MTYQPYIISLTSDDHARICSLAKEQTARYGHDRGYFTLGRLESSHEIGFEGEIAFLRFCKDVLHLKEPETCGLNEMGGRYDVYLVLDGKKHMIHIKTGRWLKWPGPDNYFGVHYGQNIEGSNAPVVLISYLKDNPRQIRIEGFMPSNTLGKQKIIKRGECFPGMKYPSRTDNWLTRFGDYQPILELSNFLKANQQ